MRPLYFVGTTGLSSWLLATSEGHILLNTGTPNSGPMIVESIRKLGFKPEDIKIIINGHGHSAPPTASRQHPPVPMK